MHTRALFVLIGISVIAISGCQQQNRLLAKAKEKGSSWLKSGKEKLGFPKEEAEEVEVAVDNREALPIDTPPPIRKQPADDVESILKSGRWKNSQGTNREMAWQYLDGGKINIYSGNEIDEAYRWEVLSRNEADRKIKIRFWNTAENENEHMEFDFHFAPNGETAQVRRYRRKNGQIDFRGESAMYRVR